MLDEPEQEYVSSSSDRFNRSVPPRRSSSRMDSKLRPDYGEDFADTYEDAREDEARSLQRGVKLKLRKGIPRSLAGRVATGVALLLILGIGIALLMLTRTFLLHDARFMIQSPSSIEIQGNKHLTRTQLLDIFGEDIERNIFRISLVDRQAELEQLPWVEHATLMRLLPGRIRVSLAERTPIAFVRQGGHIGLADADGVLLDMTPASATQPDLHYTFPVVTGLSAADPASTRAARMKIFQRFTADLDSSGEKISEKLSEVDLSNPEDLKALIPENSSEILVHFGDDHFLERYRRFQEHMPIWHAHYPNLASVDMRYEREVVLDMATAKESTSAAPTPKTANDNPPAKTTIPTKPAAIVTAHASTLHPPGKIPVKAPVKISVKTKPRPIANVGPHKPAFLVKKPRQLHATPHPIKSFLKVNKPMANHNEPTASSNLAVPATSSASSSARAGFHTKPAAGKPLLPIDSSRTPQVTTR